MDINQQLLEEELIKEQALQGADPVVTADAVIPKQDTDIDRLRRRLAELSAAESVMSGTSQALSRITGFEPTKTDLGTGDIRDELKTRLRAQMDAESAAAKPKYERESFTQFYVKAGEHKDKPIYYTPGKGMFIRDGSKIITETENPDVFRNPYKPMVEKSDYQKDLDARIRELEEYKARKPSDVQIKAIADASALFDSLNVIEQLKPGVNTGPIAAKYQEGKKYITKKDPKYVKLEGISGKALVEYMKSISGAAIAESEVQRLKNIVPNVDMDDEEFMIKLRQFRNELKRSIKSFIEANEAAGKNMDILKKGLAEKGLLSGIDSDVDVKKQPEQKQPPKQTQQSDDMVARARAVINNPGVPEAKKKKIIEQFKKQGIDL